MSKTITITLPDGYEEPSEIVIIVPGDHVGDYAAYATVLIPSNGGFREGQEIGGGTVRQVLLNVAQVIKEGVA